MVTPAIPVPVSEVVIGKLSFACMLSAATKAVAPPIRPIIFAAETFRNGRTAQIHDLRTQLDSSVAEVSP